MLREVNLNSLLKTPFGIASKIDGKCIYDSKCRSSILVYKAECKECKSFYIGNTQQHLKKRMNQHFNDVRSMVNKDEPSDSFAKHFASHFPKGINISTKDVRSKVTMSILWKGNPISCVKSFAKLKCSLCMKERLEILKALGDNSEKRLINSNNELYGACRHKSKFHMFTTTTNSSTDDGLNPEKGIKFSVDHSSYSQESTNSTNRACMYINTDFIDISNNYHDAVSPLTVQEGLVEQSI